jgi:hypothetical protein
MGGPRFGSFSECLVTGLGFIGLPQTGQLGISSASFFIVSPVLMLYGVTMLLSVDKDTFCDFSIPLRPGASPAYAVPGDAGTRAGIADYAESSGSRLTNSRRILVHSRRPLILFRFPLPRLPHPLGDVDLATPETRFWTGSCPVTQGLRQAETGTDRVGALCEGYAAQAPL